MSHRITRSIVALLASLTLTLGLAATTSTGIAQETRAAGGCCAK